MNKRFNRWNKVTRRLPAALLAVTLLVAMTGCGSADDTYLYSKSADSSTLELSESAYDSNGYFTDDYSYDSVDTTEIAEVATGSDASATDVSVTDTSRKLIKTVNLSVETKAYDELLSNVQSKASELGGYVEELYTNNGSSYSYYSTTRYASLTIRVPKEKLDDFLATVEGLSNVTSRSESVEDITLTYVDTESRKEALETEKNRLLSLMEQAETMEDLLTIEERLTEVRYELQSIESQLRTYDNQVDYSTVYLNIDEVEVYTPVEETETAWDRIRDGFVESLTSIGNGFVEFGIWLVVHLPYLLFIAAIIFVIIFVIKKLVKRAKKKAAKKAASRQATYAGQAAGAQQGAYSGQAAAQTANVNVQAQSQAAVGQPKPVGCDGESVTPTVESANETRP